jgi:3-oxoadipate enol-lactonase
VTPVVYLHPVGLDRAVWSAVASPEDACLDFPGFGTAPLGGEVTMAALADHVVDRLDQPATLIGLSLGGMVALQAAVRHPEAVASVVVACSTAATNGPALRQRAAATRAGGMDGVLESTLERWFTPAALGQDRHPGVEYARRTLRADDPEVFAAYWEAMADHDVVEELGSIGVPTTAIAGRRDLASPVAGLELIARTVPGAVLEVLDGPHMLPLENPDDFVAAVDRHHQRVAPRAVGSGG